VLDAITSTQQRLKLYSKVPPNGLVVYCGAVMTDEGKERRLTIDFEPFKPINTSLYLCDNKFHTEVRRLYHHGIHEPIVVLRSQRV
jgi:peptide chain release factor subunit 1